VKLGTDHGSTAFWIISQQGNGLLNPLYGHLGCMGIVLDYELRRIIQAF
jgi:hypothetical protein